MIDMGSDMSKGPDAALALYQEGNEADRFENPGIPPHVHQIGRAHV